jgi:hypothetical protein
MQKSQGGLFTLRNFVGRPVGSGKSFETRILSVCLVSPHCNREGDATQSNETAGVAVLFTLYTLGHTLNMVQEFRV